MIFLLTNIWVEDYSRGITKKVYAQMEALEAIGYSVDFYTGYKEDGVYIFDRYGSIVDKKLYFTNIKIINRVLRNFYLKKLAYNFLCKRKVSSQILYARYFFFDGITNKLFEIAKKNNMKVVLELHSYPCYFKQDIFLYPIYFLDFIYRKSNKKNIDYIAAMTDKKNIWEINTINFENGVNLKNVSPHIRKREENIIRLISVSYEWQVHGYDRIIRGLIKYNAQLNNKYRVEVVFVGTILKKTRKLVDKLNLHEYVEFTGVKQGKELDEIYNRCDLGMSCMALHRRSNAAVSDLKTREYMAKGLPFIFAGNQLGEIENYEYALQMPSNDNPLDINSIVSFYEKIKRDSYIVEKMRERAKRYTWEYQMKRIFNEIV